MYQRTFFQILLFFVSCLILPIASAMEIVVSSAQVEGKSNTNWTLQGEIEKGDFDKLISTIQKHGQVPTSIALDSVGGDINEAINLGHFFRKSLIGYRGVNGPDGKPVKSECSSACALIYFGAARKFTHEKSLTRIGLHQPYFDRNYLANLTPAQASSQYRKAEKTIRAYLREMSVPQAVADVMFETEATSMSYFNDHELSQWISTKSDYHQWVDDNCQRLSANESIDLRASHIEPDLFAPEYVVGLKNKYSRFLGCRQNLIAKTHASVLHELGCSTVANKTSC